ncbi:hypothetical protein M378DRAFT_110061 [Amanita muscaria Koide BX008]|uniref:asparagine--tRNA ligase n=1 Tax=Amanita muscaria (strain Koide BX008) TaxID=946122 RepID=A0A0C2WGL0_AMAMK|nr:hypothetical protein M378DRAFT_110061 [Amanita muscaria Koide BX008]
MIRRRLLSSFASSTFRLPQTISQLLAHHIDVQGSQQPATITVTGWIKSIRRQKNVSFAVLTDGSSPKGLQAVFVVFFSRLTNGSAVKLTGKLVSSRGKGQDKELVIELEGSSNTPGRVELLGECPHDTYPIQKQALSNEYLRDYAHLRARTDRIASMIRLRSALKRYISEWFETQGFHQVHTPILTGNDAEGAGEAFRIAPVQGEHPAAIAAAAASSSSATTFTPTLTSPPTPTPTPTDFFSLPAYLTVSHQLHLEALASALSRVYSLSPCFRAEPSLTARHLAEFWMLEAEWAFSASGVEEICMFVEAMLRSIVGGVLGLGGSHRSSVEEDISVLWKHNVNGGEDRLASLKDAITSRTQWTRLNYAEGIKELQNYHNSYTLGGNDSGSTNRVRFHFEPNYSKGLQSEHERWLTEHLVGGPVFITDYPLSIKPFYMRLNNHSSSTEKTGEETVACFDLLIPHLGELVGGSVREERLDVLSARMDQSGLGGPEYEWYRDLRRYGGAPHGGFGMGFERLVAWVGGIENVRECVPMPRWPGRMLL